MNAATPLLFEDSSQASQSRPGATFARSAFVAWWAIFFGSRRSSFDIQAFASAVSISRTFFALAFAFASGSPASCIIAATCASYFVRSSVIFGELSV